MARIQYDRMIMEKMKQKEISDVENQAHEARVISQADADYYLMQKQAESNKVSCYHIVHGRACSSLVPRLSDLIKHGRHSPPPSFLRAWG